MQPHHPDTQDIRLDDVFAALAHPVRLATLRAIADGDEHACNAILPQVGKSTMTHHFRILRDSGIVRQSRTGRRYTLALRREDLDSRFPGLLEAVLTSLSDDPATLTEIDAYRQVAPGA